jgi:DNA-binding NarL/FixJ family response regulator
VTKPLNRPYTIVVADDHPIVLHGVGDILGAHADLTVIARCCDGLVAENAIRDLQPDIAVLDVSMPGMTGLEILSNIVAGGGATKVVLLTATATVYQITTAIGRGVHGIVLKRRALHDLVHCVREVAAGRLWFSPEIADTQNREARNSVKRPDHPLTVRERQVMMLVSEGLSNKEVGRRLNLAEGTIKIHLHNIFDKVGVVNRTALTILAMGDLAQVDP